MMEVSGNGRSYLDILKDHLCPHFKIQIQGNSGIKSFEEYYNVGDIIAIGGYGTVYSGIRISDGLQVAIKVVPVEKVTSWVKVCNHDMPKEAFVLLSLVRIHGVINMLEYYKAPNTCIIVMERPDAKDLSQYIDENNRLQENVARRIFKQVVEILIKCHSAGIIHRDIKDENILVDLKTNSVTLIDFGSATSLQNKPYTKFRGTKVYAPPEWILFKVYNGHSATVWSLGILLYRMVCGVVPFEDDKEIVHANLNFRESLSHGSRQLVT